MKEKIINALKWFFRSFIWLFAILLVIDIVTKQVIMNKNIDPLNPIVLIPNFLNITFVKNKAAAFGIGFENPAVNRWLYVGVASVAAIGICYFFFKKHKEITLYVRACLMMILTGAVGNLIDRLFYKQTEYCVVDWIDFCGIWRWVFNIADAAVVVGAFMMIGYLIVEEVKDYKKRKASEPKVEGKVLSKTEQEKKEYLEEESKETEKVDN